MRSVESESSRLMTDIEIPDCVSSCVLPPISIVIAIISHVTSSDISQGGHRGLQTSIIIINQRAQPCHRRSGPGNLWPTLNLQAHTHSQPISSYDDMRENLGCSS